MHPATTSSERRDDLEEFKRIASKKHGRRNDVKSKPTAKSSTSLGVGKRKIVNGGTRTSNGTSGPIRVKNGLKN
jgi:hypothetical protein